MICKTCGDEKETRPYGKDGAAVCFDCAMSTNEAKREAENQFAGQLNACGPVAVVGKDVGPYPLTGTSPLH